MDAIREAEAPLRQKEKDSFVPEANEYSPVAQFEINRYTKGQFMGVFVVVQLIKDGRNPKQQIRNILAEGVDIVVAMSSLETALRRRVFR